jgi:hypothetical protein
MYAFVSSSYNSCLIELLKSYLREKTFGHYQNTNPRVQARLEILFNFFIIMNEIMVVQPFDPSLHWAISVGWDTSEAWLEGSEIVAAFICFANICSRVGGIVWSFSDT